MATSSLKKSFYITNKEEAKNLLKMLMDSLKNPPEKFKELKQKNISDSEWEKLKEATINANK